MFKVYNWYKIDFYNQLRKKKLKSLTSHTEVATFDPRALNLTRDLHYSNSLTAVFDLNPIVTEQSKDDKHTNKKLCQSLAMEQTVCHPYVSAQEQ